MKFLLDTNIVLPLEPTGPGGIEPNSALAAELMRIAYGAGHDIFIHPTLRVDVARDRNAQRLAIREVLLGKYRQLPFPPAPTPQLLEAFGAPGEGTNDWVDLQHVAAVAADAIDYLISEDAGIHRKARRVGLERRILYLADAVAVVRGLLPTPPQPPPAVEPVKAYALPLDDPFWNSLRGDYPGFDKWLQGCRLQHRDAWVIWGPHREIAGACLLKDERGPELGMEGKILKLATFKVSESHRGFRYGELLLKAAFETARAGEYDWIYVTVFEKQAELLETFENFGFDEWQERKANGELVLRKQLRPNNADRLLPAIEFHRRFGPYLVKADGVAAFVVPIQPRFHRLLFPDAEAQLSLSAGAHPFGNAIRKAYLCHAQIRQIEPGAILLFYRSETERSVRVVGVAEDTLVSDNAAAIARFVGTRTVYALRDIEEMARQSVLAILFRQARIVSPPMPLTQLQQVGVLRQPPQSIMRVPEATLPWVADLVEWTGPAGPPS
ncbi:MAG TPA: GNAT family N-acetyltransferase [Myxococcaceae bacterium]